MMELDLMAGGRCLGKPWRVGIAGITRSDPDQPFELDDAIWRVLMHQLPWQQLKTYANANGLLFERALHDDNADHDALLLVLSENPGQLLGGLSSQVRRYLLLRGGQARLVPEHETSFTRIFLPLGEPFTDGQLVSLNQPLRLPAAPVVREEWLLCDEEPELPGLLPRQWCECLETGRVPVHLGNWPVPEWLPQGSYIQAHDLSGQSTLHSYCNAGVKAAAKILHDFLANKSSYPYSSDCWITALTAAIAGDAAAVRDDRPLLSVIIPAFNYGRFLKQTISSVLDQGYDSVEILVLDNASTDNTSKVLSAFASEPRVRYFRNARNVGPSYNVLNGIQIAQGHYLSLLMADDYYNPGFLSKLLPRMLANPEVVVGYTAIRWVNEQGNALNAPRHPGYEQEDYVGGRNEVAELLIHDSYIPPSAALIQREPFLQVWRRDPGLNGAGDWLSMVQVAERHPDFIFLSEPGVTYRTHSAQLSTEFYSSNAPLSDHIRLVEGVFERGAQSRLRGREREVAAHLHRRLALYPAEQSSSLAARVGQLCERLEQLAALGERALFSIVLTTYNRPAMLLDALRSIGGQTLRDFEVILVNDHGDPVEALLDGFEFPLTYLRLGANGGPAAARNAALQLARGRYVTFLDDDDLLLPDHLQSLATALGDHPDAVVYADAVFVTEQSENGARTVLAREERYAHDTYSKERLFVDNYIPINTFACPLSLAKAAGDFDETLTGLEDWDFLLRLASRSGFIHVPCTTVEVRMRVPGEASERRSEQASKDYAELYQEIYRRHSDLGSAQVRQGRAAQLRRLGVVVKGGAASVRNWLAARTLTPVQQRLIAQYQDEHKDAAAQLCIVITDMDDDRPALERSLDSVRNANIDGLQPLIISASPPPAELQGIWVQADSDNWVSVLNEQLRAASCDWIMLLKAGDELAESGLLMLSLELQGDPQCRAIYCDALYRQDDGEYGAALRPDFNLDYLLSFPRGVAQHWLYYRAHLVDLDGFNPEMGAAMELDLILRLVDQGGVAGLGHISEPLVISAAPVLSDSPDERAAILRHLQARGYEHAQLNGVHPGQYRVEYGHSEQPSVSLVVIVKDDLAMAQRCVMSVLENTRYPHYEILLIDNQSQEAATCEWLAGVEQMGTSQIKVLRSSELLSHSEACNQAALNADGEYLLLLRSDVAVIEPDWLDALMNHGQRAEVGVVGARTVNAEGRVTHAGLVLGLQGPAAGVFLGEPLDAPGYMQRLQVDLNMSAVADSCLLVRKSLFMQVGGMDAEHFADQGADVDLCLRVSDTGHLVVWTPRATLLHGVEKKVMPVATEDALYARWLPRLARDPAYNSNFSLSQPGGFKLADPQISWRPLNVFRPVPVVLAHPADEMGCGQYRIIQPFNALRSVGLIDGALSRGLMHVTDLERYAPDVVVLQRQISAERLEAMRRMRAFSGAFKVYELDDYLPNLPLKSVHRSHMPRDIVKSLRRGLSYVDRFVVSTEAIAEAFADFHPDIQVRHNTLDPRFWGASLPESERRTAAKPRVGWAGGASHTGDLEMIEDVIKALAGEVEWVFFGMCPDRLRPYIHEYHPGVPIAQYPAALARLNLDLAMAPVEQNLFNECKSNLRLLEYGACGYPVICSDIRCYSGDLPATRVKNRYRDWVDAIRMHLSDPDASEAMGNALREQVKGQWMLEGANLDGWREVWLPD
jgi:O-antigen biosynthesis protein